ncbi:MAG: transcription termination/antitermination protein NusG [Oligoflexia bacterium]|nr:transcription termination/antitermination protein NusG [Oligoflexia bacterium]MBF0367659.1 transcription termination/antitermination protein NusG [Oligoflexia bacterium]
MDEAKKKGSGTVDAVIGATEHRWYVAHVLTGYEDKVKQSLLKRIHDHHMEELFSEIYVVKSKEEIASSQKNGKTKKRSVTKNFFPGYILIKMIMNDKTWHLVKSTDKITGFVGANKSKPSPISNEEAAYLTDQAVDGFKKTKLGSNFSEGDSVRVIEGPFATFIGTIETITDKGRVRVQVSIFGRPTPVELDFSQIEKV